MFLRAQANMIAERQSTTLLSLFNVDLCIRQNIAWCNKKKLLNVKKIIIKKRKKKKIERYQKLRAKI